MSAPDLPSFDARSDFKAFWELGHLHALRAFAFFETRTSDYRKLLGETLRLERELAGRMYTKGANDRRWGDSVEDPRVPRPDNWQWQYQRNVPAGGPVPTRSVLGLRIGASAFDAVAKWDVSNVIQSPFEDVNTTQQFLYSSHYWLIVRARVLEALQTARGGSDQRAHDLAVARHSLDLAGPEQWQQWLGFYEGTRPSSLNVVDLDVRRGVIDVLDSQTTFARPVDRLAPEVIGAHVRWSGAVLNRAEMFDGDRPPAGMYTDAPIDHNIGIVCGGLYNEAILRTGDHSPVPQKSYEADPGSLEL